MNSFEICGEHHQTSNSLKISFLPWIIVYCLQLITINCLPIIPINCLPLIPNKIYPCTILNHQINCLHRKICNKIVSPAQKSSILIRILKCHSIILPFLEMRILIILIKSFQKKKKDKIQNQQYEKIYH